MRSRLAPRGPQRFEHARGAMRIRGRWVGLAVLVVVAALGIGLWSKVFSVFVSRCQTDDELPASERDPYEQTALRFAQHIVKSDTRAAYAEFTSELKQTISLERLVATV